MKQSSADQVRVVRNAGAANGAYPEALRAILSLSAHHTARAIIESWPGYSPTPLHELPRTAHDLGLGRLWLKDESTRFGLGAFKAIGGAYAVYQLLADQIRARKAADVSVSALLEGRFHDVTAHITVACASAGNHGRAVAWGAHLFGARCVVHLYEGVSAARRRAIEELGATVDMSAPGYDEAVRRVAHTAATQGWFIVSDTSYPGYLDVPRTVMQGYTLIAQEVLQASSAVQQVLEARSAVQRTGQNGIRPTHVILQAGVGGFAAAVAAHFWESLEQRPVFISVEPSGAACVLESIAAGTRVDLPHVDSIMGGLCCGTVSPLAWEVLRHAIDVAVAVPDALTIEAMRRLAQPAGERLDAASGAHGRTAWRETALLDAETRTAPHKTALPDAETHAAPGETATHDAEAHAAPRNTALPAEPRIVSGESGAAGLAALLALRDHSEFSAIFGNARAAEVLIFSTEGAQDADAWGRHTGISLEVV